MAVWAQCPRLWGTPLTRAGGGCPCAQPGWAVARFKSPVPLPTPSHQSGLLLPIPPHQLRFSIPRITWENFCNHKSHLSPSSLPANHCPSTSSVLHNTSVLWLRETSWESGTERPIPKQFLGVEPPVPQAALFVVHRFGSFQLETRIPPIVILAGLLLLPSSSKRCGKRNGWDCWTIVRVCGGCGWLGLPVSAGEGWRSQG